MNAFLTGSRVYGKVKPDSDIDLVVLLDHDSAEIIRKLSDDPIGPVRFGSLNLIICTDETMFMAWKLGTRRCLNLKAENKKPFSKEQAAA